MTHYLIWFYTLYNPVLFYHYPASGTLWLFSVTVQCAVHRANQQIILTFLVSRWYRKIHFFLLKIQYYLRKILAVYFNFNILTEIVENSVTYRGKSKYIFAILTKWGRFARNFLPAQIFFGRVGFFSWLPVNRGRVSPISCEICSLFQPRKFLNSVIL